MFLSGLVVFLVISTRNRKKLTTGERTQYWTNGEEHIENCENKTTEGRVKCREKPQL